MKKLKLPLLATLLCVFSFFVYVPFVSYFSSINEFPFTFTALAQSLLVPSAVVAVCVAVIFILLQRMLPRIFLQETPFGTVTPVYIVLFSILFCLWLEGFILNYNLPQLTGEQNLFSSKNRLFIDSFIWVIVVCFGLLFWRKLAKHIFAIALGLFFVMTLGIADSWIKSEPKIHTRTTADYVFQQMKFNKDNNVFILVLDAMSTRLMVEYIANVPEVRNEFDGFTLYKNNIHSADMTHWSLSSILRGDTFESGSFLEYSGQAITKENSLPQLFSGLGYNVYLSSLMHLFCSVVEDGKNIYGETTRHRLSLTLYEHFFIRFSPYYIKNIIANRIGFIVPQTKFASSLPDRGEMNHDEYFYSTVLPQALRAESSQPTFHFHHINGAHMPYETGTGGKRLPASERQTILGLDEQVRWNVQQCVEFFQKMKNRGIYDGSTIVILGDHGDRANKYRSAPSRDADFAGLMIKPAHKTSTFSISSAPTSNTYLAKIIPDMHVAKMTDEKYFQSLPTERLMYSYGSGTINVYSGIDIASLDVQPVKKIEFEYPPNYLDLGISYSLSLNNYNFDKAYPAETENMTILNGWGLFIRNGMGKASFLTKEKEPVTLVLNLYTSASGGGPAVGFSPYSLKIIDTVSMKEHTFTISEVPQDVTLYDVNIDSNEKIELQFDLPTLKGVIFYFHTIRLEKSSK